MSTIGWLFILVAGLVIRQVSRGRVSNITQDLSDAFIAFASGDTDALGAVLARTGNENSFEDVAKAIGAMSAQAAVGTSVASGTVIQGIGNAWSGLSNAISGSISLAAITLGQKAKGYRWAASGPDYYDCSGLMWRAVQAIGYTGGRFSTGDIPHLSAFKRVSTPTLDDIVLWPAGSGGVTGHMGVIVGTDQFYSARSPRSGIGVSPVSSFRKTTPEYYRYVGPRKTK